MAREEASDRKALTDAMDHLRTAIAILDSADAPAQIAAHLDLALCQLAEIIGCRPEANAQLNSDPDLN